MMLLALRDTPGDMTRCSAAPGIPCQQRTRVVDPAWVWQVPFAPLSMAETVTAIGNLIQMGRPTFFITANTHYVMLTQQNPDLQVINAKAALILADGAPLVWASRCMGSPLPERVAGSDLVFELSAEAVKQGYRLFLVGVPRESPSRRPSGCASSTPDSKSSARSVPRCTN